MTSDRLYTLYSSKRPGSHLLELHVPPGVAVYTLTFG